MLLKRLLGMLFRIWRRRLRPFDRIRESYRGARRRTLMLSIVRLQPGAAASEIHRTAKHGYSLKTTQRDLKILVDQGVVRMTGLKRWARYYPAETMFDL